MTDTRVSRAVEDYVSIEQQLLIWGYCVTGDGSELDSWRCEYRGVHPTGKELWDRDAAWLDSILLNGERPPERLALPYVTRSP